MTNKIVYRRSTFGNQKSTIVPHRCRICGAPAEYSYFGVISCPPCKMFFKRNANAGRDVVKCDFDGHCEIYMDTRHTCSSCRLDKCFKCGMTTDKFRPSRQKKVNTNTLVKVQRQHRSERLPTLNLLQADQSLLTTDQWTLLSNLYNGYKESHLLSIGQRLIQTYNPTKSTDVIYRALVEEFSASLYETAGAYLRLNNDVRQLSSGRRSILLRSAADNVVCMGSVFTVQYCHLDVLNTFLNVVKEKYGKRAIDIHRWATRFTDPDIVIAKLAISLSAFSENTFAYALHVTIHSTNPIDILHIQNKYAEVTWKYLIYRYGDYEAVKRFLNLTLWLRAISMLTFHGRTVIAHVNDVDSLVEQTELDLILDDVDQIIETD